MKSRTRRRAVTLITTTALCTLASAQTTTMTATAGGGDSWNDPANWTGGVPTGTASAVVSSGLFAQVESASTQSYTGTLTLDAGATLKMHCSGGGCLGPDAAVAGAARIFMGAGSEIQVNMNTDVNFPPITLLGDAKLSSLFGASDWEIDTLAAIDGAFTLTLEHFNGHEVNLIAANGFSTLICDTVDRWHLHGMAAGSFGTGDVTVNPRADGRSASLHFDVGDVMADDATLTLNGSAGQGGFSGDGSDYVIMNADDTIGGLWVWGVQLPAGAYTSSEPWLDGPGTLTVASGANYCTGTVNSTGSGASMSASGSSSVSANDLVLFAALVPDQPGLFFYGPDQVQIPFGNGFRCVGGTVGRLDVHNAVANTLSHDLDVTQPPNAATTITAGTSWNFQCWYRDPAAGGASFNLSDGLEITFQP